ncbi:hypothetical protein GTZ85_15830 [Streptomyces sp. SID5474]|nr:hypothetical protein [Streptomyces sp. SID5474]
MTVVVAWMIGNSMRRRRDHRGALHTEAAARAVVAERLRIARELHDMVAHNIGVVAIHAGATNLVIDTRPAGSRKALNAIETTSRETRAGLRRMRRGGAGGVRLRWCAARCTDGPVRVVRYATRRRAGVRGTRGEIRTRTPTGCRNARCAGSRGGGGAAAVGGCGGYPNRFHTTFVLASLIRASSEEFSRSRGRRSFRCRGVSGLAIQNGLPPAAATTMSKRRSPAHHRTPRPSVIADHTLCGIFVRNVAAAVPSGASSDSRRSVSFPSMSSTRHGHTCQAWPRSRTTPLLIRSARPWNIAATKATARQTAITV